VVGEEGSVAGGLGAEVLVTTAAYDWAWVVVVEGAEEEGERMVVVEEGSMVEGSVVFGVETALSLLAGIEVAWEVVVEALGGVDLEAALGLEVGGMEDAAFPAASLAFAVLLVADVAEIGLALLFLVVVVVVVILAGWEAEELVGLALTELAWALPLEVDGMEGLGEVMVGLASVTSFWVRGAGFKGFVDWSAGSGGPVGGLGADVALVPFRSDIPG
jgi:hypothetical protein